METDILNTELYIYQFYQTYMSVHNEHDLDDTEVI